MCNHHQSNRSHPWVEYAHNCLTSAATGLSPSESIVGHNYFPVKRMRWLFHQFKCTSATAVRFRETVTLPYSAQSKSSSWAETASHQKSPSHIPCFIVKTSVRQSSALFQLDPLRLPSRFGSSWMYIAVAGVLVTWWTGRAIVQRWWVSRSFILDPNSGSFTRLIRTSLVGCLGPPAPVQGGGEGRDYCHGLRSALPTN